MGIVWRREQGETGIARTCLSADFEVAFHSLFQNGASQKQGMDGDVGRDRVDGLNLQMVPLLLRTITPLQA